MVRLHEQLPRDAAGNPDLETWVEDLSDYSQDERDRLRIAVTAVASVSEEQTRAECADLVELLLDLQMDFEAILAGVFLFPLRQGLVNFSDIRDDTVEALLAQILRMASADGLASTSAPLLANESRDQIDNVRHMLVALIDDPRVAIVKLAERVVVLRQIKNAPRDVQKRISREVLDFFSPLASRLGIWQLKWFLEDLAFRYLYPDEYRAIAARLDGRREEREVQVDSVRRALQMQLAQAGIDAQVHGRAKHIYSIWRKMQEKHIDFSQVYDVEAVRVLVPSVQACYSVLGIVHTTWQHIPSEFDDYVTNPKENGYRSIHTAVLGPSGRTLEVQIRTFEMHDEAELGVCAHWTYKGDDGDALRSEKMEWLRQVLEWHDELGGDVTGMPDALDLGTSHERVFVSTPQGHVVDLSAGATAVDFAYRVHTEVGHRCTAARVDGQLVPLNFALTTGQVVEIVTAEEEAPRRDWLNPALGYVKTSRARTKIQAWFREQVAELNVTAGKALLEDSFQRLNVSVDYGTLAAERGFESETQLFLAVGVGDLLVVDLVRGVLRRPVQDRQLSLLPNTSQQFGVPSLQSIVIYGADRQGLLRDITAVLAAMSISVVATTARADASGASATISIELRIQSLLELARVIDRIRRIPDVHDVRRAYAS